MVFIGKKHLRLDIWLETLKQAKSTKDMIRSILDKKAHWRYKTNKIKSYLLFPSGKKARFVGPLHYYDYLIAN